MSPPLNCGGVPQVFLINLRRRADRRARMLRTLHEQEITCKLVEAVDGKWVPGRGGAVPGGGGGSRVCTVTQSLGSRWSLGHPDTQMWSLWVHRDPGL